MQKKIVLTFFAIIWSFTFIKISECATRKSWKKGEYAQLESPDVSVKNKVVDINKNSVLKIGIADVSIENKIKALDLSHENSSEQSLNSEAIGVVEVEIETPDNSSKLNFEDDVANIFVDKNDQLVNVSFSEQSLKDIFTGSKIVEVPKYI